LILDAPRTSFSPFFGGGGGGGFGSWTCGGKKSVENVKNNARADKKRNWEQKDGKNEKRTQQARYINL
jgi:hypothetical protein